MELTAAHYHVSFILATKEVYLTAAACSSAEYPDIDGGEYNSKTICSSVVA
jgi:hypothetical protein